MSDGIEEELHWYSFSFLGNDLKGRQGYGSSFNSRDTKNVSISRIDEAKETAGMSKDSTLLSVNYLGYMTYTEFTR